MNPVRRHVSTRMTLALGLLLAVLLSAGYAWLSLRGEALIAQEETNRAQLTTNSMIASLNTIMLAGRGDAAYEWLQSIARLRDVESAKIYRLDGAEAFADQKTIRAVNHWLGQARFQRKPGAGKAAPAPARIADQFRAIAQGKAGQLSIRDGDHLTFLYPIKAESKCLQCHGYTDNPLRGVMALRISTAATAASLQDNLNETLVLFAGIAVLLMLGAWVIVRFQVISPLSKLTDMAVNIRGSDLSQRVHLDYKDEFGAVAEAFDGLIVHLEKTNQRLLNHEIELELVNEELASASEAKSQFLANTSHELRTPLNAIIGFSELLGNPQLGPLTEKQQRYVGHVHVSSKRLLHIINDLLDISKIEAGMMAIEEDPCVLAEIARQAVSELTPLGEAKRLHLALRADAGADVSVIADAGKLRQMLVNLTGNAIKFTPEGGKVDVSVRVEGQAKNECRLIIEVKDTGIGIKEEDQERIFEPFFQVSGGLDRKHDGTGLGLTLTRRQVNLLGGDLSLESKPGSGSRFSISIPARRVSGTKEQEQGMAPQPETASPAEVIEIIPEHGPRPRILVADEDRKRGEFVVCMMEQEGYDAMFVETARITQTAAYVYPFMLMIGIADQAGETYARLQMLKTRDSTRSLPIILIGGKADEPEFSMGTVGIMANGIGRQELLDTIACHGRHAPLRPEIPTVLVVDNDASVRELMKETLVSEGYRTLVAANGKEGVRIAIEYEPDLIILDLMMPGVSGFDVVNCLRKHPAAADIPIVIYTATDISREEALRLGRNVERVLLKGADGRREILRQLHKLELAYPLQAHLIDTRLRCFNHRYLLRRLDQETAHAKRHGQKFSLLGWQMDGYDDYVREHGDRWGIAALKEMIETVKAITRHGDVCARIDEARFVLFLPDITPAGAMRVAQKLRIRIRHQRFPLPRDEFGSFTALAGVVHFDADTKDAGALLQILAERIDEAASGGNKSTPGRT